jgi:hypothetical protein
MTSRDQLQETLCNRLFWHTAERDDAIIAEHLFHHREMDVVYAMDEATLFDSFFNYLREIDVFPLLEHLDPQNRKRKNVPFIPLVLVFLMKVIGSVKTIDEISDLLLTALALIGGDPGLLIKIDPSVLGLWFDRLKSRRRGIRYKADPFCSITQREMSRVSPFI